MDYRFTTLDEATATAMTITPGANDEHRVLFKQWAWEAIKNIGPTRHWVKSCKITPKNLSFKKPDDLASTISIALYDSTDTEVPFEWGREGAGRVSPDRQMVHATVGESCSVVDLSEDGYYFHLGSTGTNVAYAMVRYLALPLDANKLPLIPEDNIMAIAFFCRWMWSMRKGDNQSEQQLARDNWFRERDRIFGDNKMPSVFRAKEMGKWWFSLINGYKPNRF